MLLHLACEAACLHTVSRVSTFKKLWHVVIEVNDGYLDLCSGTGLDPVYVYVFLSGLQ